MILGLFRDELLVPWSMSTYMEAHTEDHSSPAQSALVYGITTVAIDSIIYRKALFKIHPHEFQLQLMACPDSLAL